MRGSREYACVHNLLELTVTLEFFPLDLMQFRLPQNNASSIATPKFCRGWGGVRRDLRISPHDMWSVWYGTRHGSLEENENIPWEEHKPAIKAAVDVVFLRFSIGGAHRLL